MSNEDPDVRVRASDLELRALKALDCVTQGEPTEDSRVECKSIWPADHWQAARQIAGHANAAQGEPITWIIGADEKGKQVPGAKAEELTSWWAQVSNKYDGLAPTMLQHINIPYHDKTVVALLFATDRAPYVVKNPEQGRIQYEVPWREATGVRTARREDLLRILVPAQRAPTVDTVEASFSVTRPSKPIFSTPSTPEPKERDLRLLAHLYFVPRSRDALVIPFHRCECLWRSDPKENWARFSRVWLEPYSPDGLPDTKLKSPHVHGSRSDIVIDGPAMVTLKSGFRCASDPAIESKELFFLVQMIPAGARSAISIELALGMASPGHWACRAV